MGWLDMIDELRHSKADSKKASKALFFFGIMALVSLAGFILTYKEDDDFLFKKEFIPYLTAAQISIGVLFLLSAYGIYKEAAWGKRLGQFSIVMFLLLVLAPPIFFVTGSPIEENYIFLFPFLIISCLFGVVVYFGIRYLGRLPVGDSTVMPDQQSLDKKFGALPEAASAAMGLSEQSYVHSPFPIGLLGTFIIYLIILMGIMSALIGKMGDMKEPAYFVIFFPFIFLIFFLVPTVYNFISSPFEKSHNKVASFTGGGSIFLFNGSWPFFRLFIYDDGLELRVFFHDFFIPYDKMEAPPEKLGFFSRGLLIKSDLSGVPSSIRFATFGMKNVLTLVNNHRNRYLESKAPDN